NKVEVVDVTPVRDEFPMLVRILADVALDDETVPRYQLLVGVRPTGESAEFLRGSDDAVLGAVDTPEGEGYAYDAVLDHELGIALLHEVLPDEEVQLVRPMGVEQSNTSLVYDDRLVLKIFRHLDDGPNPDVE